MVSEELGSINGNITSRSEAHQSQGRLASRTALANTVEINTPPIEDQGRLEDAEEGPDGLYYADNRGHN